MTRDKKLVKCVNLRQVSSVERVEVGEKKEESGRTVRIYAFGIVMARVTLEIPIYYSEEK